MIKTLSSVILLLVAGAVGLTLLKIRNADHDPALWHVDPLMFESAPTPNHFRLAPGALTEQEVDMEAPVFTGDIKEIAQAFDIFVLNQKDTILLAGSVDEGWLTYVQRTPGLKFPDYISVKFIPAADPAKVTIAIYSRSRYGNGDMGVNAARVGAWIKSLDAFIEDGTGAAVEAETGAAVEAETGVAAEAVTGIAAEPGTNTANSATVAN